MRRRVTVLALLVPALAFAGPHGKVVRVERQREVSQPRICGLLGPTQMICVGEPAQGESIALVDQRRGQIVGTLRAERSSESRDLGICTANPPSIYKVDGTLTEGNPDQIADAGNVMGVRGVRLDGRAKVLHDVASPSGADSSVEIALDYDGDSQPDLIVTQYSCDTVGASSPLSAGRVCLDTYVRKGAKLERTEQDILQRCM
jgi:hypothetical protein